ncbi:hypothetical protein RUM44_004642 [Polyplax serrata]|uniref:Uncharacterized protein n=1 Tax=Polyplax serrata TaxID=468196 RepID=A0ABR1B3F5_POLSC
MGWKLIRLEKKEVSQQSTGQAQKQRAKIEFITKKRRREYVSQRETPGKMRLRRGKFPGMPETKETRGRVGAERQIEKGERQETRPAGERATLATAQVVLEFPWQSSRQLSCYQRENRHFACVFPSTGGYAILFVP